MTCARKIVLGTVVALVALAVIEAMSAVVIHLASSRLAEPILTTSTIYADQSTKIRSLFFSDSARGLMFDAELGWKYRAGYRDATTVRNSAGLRGEREYAPHPETGTLRVAAFGDSFVYGNETSWTESWPAQLEQLDSSIEVLNYGVGGYGVDQAYLRFLLEGSAFAPSVVLICFTTDDLRRLVSVYRRFISPLELPLVKPRFELDSAGGLRLLPTPIRAVEDYRALLMSPERVRAFGTFDDWYEPLVYQNPAYDLSPTVRLVSSVWIRVANRYFRKNRIFEGGSLNQEAEAFKIQVALFDSFRDSVLAAGYRPIIVFLPDRESVAARATGDKALYAPLASRLEALAIPFLDAGDAFAAEGVRAQHGEWFMPGGHYSPAGNTVVAEWLLPLLRAASGRTR